MMIYLDVHPDVAVALASSGVAGYMSGTIVNLLLG